MQIRLTADEPSTAGFISWKRLVDEYLQCELKAGEQIAILNISGNGINFFVTARPVTNGQHQSEAT